ncbi:MAG: acyl carrier protein [Deltaproteobacteria bacterium]|jgi:acyl carrier protein|nr:acyl carrier protein [Deltaproteobacteria bacterium]
MTVCDEGQIFEGLKKSLEDGLGRQLPDLRQSDRLIPDLGLDSLDMLDLVFRLERMFGVRLSPREYENRVKKILGDAPLAEDGKYTAQAVAEFRKAMPCVPESDLQPGLPVSELGSLFQVRTFMNMVAEAVGRKEA